MTAVWDTVGNPISVWDTFGNLIWGHGDQPDPPEPIDPDTIAGQIAAARPYTFAQTWDIAADGSRDFTTIAAATAAARAAIIDENGTREPTRLSPYRRHRFRIWPGEYKEPNPAFPSHFALIGMGGKPEDVRIWDDRGTAGTGGTDEQGGKSGENIINSSGRSMWVENLWLDHQSDDPEWHALRIVGPSGNVGENGYTRMTAVFSRVRMTSASNGMAGKCAFDATVTHYDILMDRVHFDTPGQPQAINLHIGYNAPHRSAVTFHGCSVTAGYDFIDDPTLPHGGRFADGTIAGAIPVAIQSPQAGADVAYWVETPDSVWDVGRQAPAPETPPRGALGIVPSAVSRTAYHVSELPVIDLESPSLIVNDGGGWLPDPTEYDARGTVDRSIPAMIPELTIRDGASEGELAFYGPDPAVVPPPATLTATGPAELQTFPTGRIYYVPLTLPSVGFQLDSVDLDLTGAGQIAVASAYADPSTGVPYSTAAQQLWKAGAVATGTPSVAMARRWYYPGHDTMWIAIGTQGATGAGALATDAGRTVYYADGYEGGTLPDMASLSILPDGEPYPVVTAVMI